MAGIAAQTFTLLAIKQACLALCLLLGVSMWWGRSKKAQCVHIEQGCQDVNAMQEALQSRKSVPSAAAPMADLIAAAGTVAAVAAAGRDEEESQLALEALEQPCLQGLEALCRNLCSAAQHGQERDLDPLASCLCATLRLIQRLAFPIEKQVSRPRCVSAVFGSRS